MARRSKQSEPDEAPGAPEWMVTFSDCMTLLLTFFVLLLSFSSFDERVFRKLKVIFSEALPSANRLEKTHKDAFLNSLQIESTADLDKGSEKPTLESGNSDRLKEQTGPADFRRQKVFIISSKKVFWGKGKVISYQGRGVLATMASFLREAPSRVVVSENAGRIDEAGEQLGLERAWAIIEYLTTKQGLRRGLFNISAQSTITQDSRDSLSNEDTAVQNHEPERTLEIVLLEPSIYN